MTLKGIIFDLDGTIVNSEYVQFLVFDQLVKPNEIKWEFWQSHYFGKSAPEILEDLSRRFSMTFDSDNSHKGLEIYQDLIKKGHMKFIDGFSDFFDWINKIGLQYIIASNSEPAFIEMTLEGVELLDKIDYISSEEVENSKPDPELYYLATKRLNLPPEECLIMEDWGECITTAKKMGASAIAITSGFDDKALFNAADLIIQDFNDPRLKTFISEKMRE